MGPAYEIVPRRRTPLTAERGSRPARNVAAETGQTPMQWLAGVRIRHAQQMLETTGYGVERVGREVGFTSPTNFREQFRRLTGVSPQSYRSTFRERIAG